MSSLNLRNRKDKRKEEAHKKEKTLIPSFGTSSDHQRRENSKAEILKKKKEKIKIYRNGGEGCCTWAEENLRISIYRPGNSFPEWIPLSEIPKEKNQKTGRSPYDMWQRQKEILCRALEMKDGSFIYRLIVLCWMRGESKSFIVCLIMLWKFLCFPKQTIVLGANSKDQVKFVHFDIIKELAINSPNIINIIGRKNIQEKEIRLKNSKNDIISLIRPISSFSGIVSNINGYTFSEIFDMKRPKFFEQLHGSIRNIPNAFGAIDSTVSEKTHILYKLYKTYVNGKDKSLFFNHRESRNADYQDFWNPEMTQQQLDSYKNSLVNFDQYFKNTWDAGSKKPLTEGMLNACAYVGYDNQVVLNDSLISILSEKIEYQRRKSKSYEVHAYNMPKAQKMVQHYGAKIAEIDSRLKEFPELKGNTLMNIDQIDAIGDIYNTDWAILCGLDRADPMKANIDTGARTVLSVIAKGLLDSRFIKKDVFDDDYVPKFIYVPIGMFHIQDSSLEAVKNILNDVQLQYGIDSFCSERWGVWDMAEWLEANDIHYEILHPTYEKQRAAFSEMFAAISNGRFKLNLSEMPGSKEDNIFLEEGQHFVHHFAKKQYQSDEKEQVHGVQDDCLYSVGWALYGGRTIMPSQFRTLQKKGFFGMYLPPDEFTNHGNYKR